MVRRVEEMGWTLAMAAEAAGVSVRTVSKWLGRYRAESEGGLIDGSSVPRSIPHRTPEKHVQAIAALRRLGMTAAEIGEVLSMPVSTVSAVLGRIGLGKRSLLEPAEPPNRYERQRAGELLHIDVKKLGRIDGAGHRVTNSRKGKQKGIGWEYVHVCVDDATRLAYVEVLNDEKATTAVGFLRRAVAYFANHGIRTQGIMTDNGSCYRAIIHALACKTLGIKHLTTRPYRPRTNGKAERFIRTLLGSWAYAAIYQNSTERTRALPCWLNHYNHTRPHRSLSNQPPIQRLEALRQNNLAGSYN
jgi:transposase InsO family protein